MSPVPTTDPAAEGRAPLGAPSGRSAHAEHRLLRAEQAQLAHWRRLLRARLDLAVARLAPPERLGVLTSDLLGQAVTDLPDLEELRAAVTVPAAEDTVELMHRIRVLDRALRTYSEHIDAAREGSTQAMIHDLATTRSAAPSEAAPA